MLLNPSSTLGAQIDGHIAVVGHTHVCGLSDKPMTGPQADAVCAAHSAAYVVQGLLVPGMKVCLLSWAGAKKSMPPPPPMQITHHAILLNY